MNYTYDERTKLLIKKKNGRKIVEMVVNYIEL